MGRRAHCASTSPDCAAHQCAAQWPERLHRCGLRGGHTTHTRKALPPGSAVGRCAPPDGRDSGVSWTLARANAHHTRAFTRSAARMGGRTEVGRLPRPAPHRRGTRGAALPPRTEMAPALPDITAAAAQLQDTTALDGELVVWEATGSRSSGCRTGFSTGAPQPPGPPMSGRRTSSAASPGPEYGVCVDGAPQAAGLVHRLASSRGR